MSAYALVDLFCPHCDHRFIENAKLVRAGGQAWCPECSQLFVLDATSERMRRVLAEAKAARRRRKDRMAELRERWADPAPPRPVQQKPLLISDVLKTLDALLARLDGPDDDEAPDQLPVARG